MESFNAFPAEPGWMVGCTAIERWKCGEGCDPAADGPCPENKIHEQREAETFHPLVAWAVTSVPLETGDGPDGIEHFPGLDPLFLERGKVVSAAYHREVHFGARLQGSSLPDSDVMVRALSPEMVREVIGESAELAADAATGTTA
jgi:hypothetical protein